MDNPNLYPIQNLGYVGGGLAGENASSAKDAGDILSQYNKEIDSAVEEDWLYRGYSGGMSKADAAKFKADAALNLASAREAREWEAQQANTAWQRKVADMEKAGFSKLAALEGSQGAAVASAEAAKAGSGNGGGNSGANLGGILGAIVSAIAFVASKGMSAAASAKNAASLEAIRQSNRVALEAIRQNAIDSRAQVHSFTLTDPHGIRHTYTNRGAKKKNPLDFW